MQEKHSINVFNGWEIQWLENGNFASCEILKNPFHFWLRKHFLLTYTFQHPTSICQICWPMIISDPSLQAQNAQWLIPRVLSDKVKVEWLINEFIRVETELVVALIWRHFQTWFACGNNRRFLVNLTYMIKVDDMKCPYAVREKSDNHHLSHMSAPY